MCLAIGMGKGSNLGKSKLNFLFPKVQRGLKVVAEAVKGNRFISIILCFD